MRPNRISHRCAKLFTASILIASWLAACTPTPPAGRPTPTPTPTSSPTPTAPPPDQPTRSIPTPTPGPAQAFWYRTDDTIYRYDFGTWTSTPLISSAGEIADAALSGDGQRLVYLDSTGLWSVDLTAGTEPSALPAKGKVLEHSLQLSPDGAWLAYTDSEGLKIADLSTGETRLFLARYQNAEDETDMRDYTPIKWSPDKVWLIVWVSHWEGGRMILASVATGDLHPLSGCYPDISWSPDGRAFAMAVRYSGYLVCGEKDGIYVVSVAGGVVTERQIYDAPPAEVDERNGPMSVAWNATGEWIAFVQEEYAPDLGKSRFSLMLISPDGAETHQVASTRQAMWARDGSALYYVQWGEESNTIYRMNAKSLEQDVLYSVPEPLALIAVSPDGRWLAIGKRDAQAITDVRFLDTASGQVIPMDKLGSVNFVGWTWVN